MIVCLVSLDHVAPKVANCFSLVTMKEHLVHEARYTVQLEHRLDLELLLKPVLGKL